MSERETVPQRMAAVADAAEHVLNGNGGTTEVMLAVAMATLRAAAAAWPVEPRITVRPPSVSREVVEQINQARGLGTVIGNQALADSLDDMHEAGRRLGFEQGMAKCREYTAAAEQDERDAAARRGESVPGTRETVKVANVAGVVAGHWRQRRQNSQVDHELIGAALASLLDALLAEVDHALDATAPRD